ncbi:hypothetical protein RJ639_008256 [Escallonia herrerae]|uniref:Cytochrome P450 n=1 Tax=Escallonia herrerae TaxID=1293975 RepID=A0AA88VRY7_9ASTE|nr:hypothetical protein RJ639_008256 [Escallonia herrerae]
MKLKIERGRGNSGKRNRRKRLGIVSRVNWEWLKPKKLEKSLRGHGLAGNPYRLLIGDLGDYSAFASHTKSKTISLSDDIAPHVLPYVHHVIQKYGKNSFMWFGPNPRVNIVEPDLMKEIMSKPNLFQKPPDPLGEIITAIANSFQSFPDSVRRLVNCRFIPTKANKRMKEVISELQVLLRGVVRKREKAMEMGEARKDDLLGILMESNFKEIRENGIGLSIEEVIAECKLFYFGGSGTTSSLLVWTMILLCKYPHWQGRAREEVLQVFGKEDPDLDGLNRLKVVRSLSLTALNSNVTDSTRGSQNSKSYELGRSYKLGGQRKVYNKTCFTNLDIKSNGVFGATNGKVSYLPFGGGPRVCIGQKFSMIEAKMAIATIFRRFSFELSPSYAHAPFPLFTLQPQHGAQLILHKL